MAQPVDRLALIGQQRRDRIGAVGRDRQDHADTAVEGLEHLGLFDTANLAASAVLMPVAPLATLAGAWIVKRMKPEIFYPFMYVMIMLVGLKLVWDATIGG